MTSGNLRKQMLSFAFPIFLSSLFQNLYNIADSLIVSRYVGKTALAAVSSSGNLIHLFNSFFIGMAMGAGTLISKYFGARDQENMSRAIHTDVAVGLISGALLTVAGVALTPAVLRLMNTAPEVLPQSITYFRYYFLGCLAIVMYNVFNGILNAVGNSRRPLVYLIISSCLNVLLDLLFVGVFRTGVAGAAIATTISQFVSAMLCLGHLVKEGNSYRVELRKVRVHRDMLKDILHYGIPGGVQNSVIGLANVIVQANINVFGEDAMAGCGAYSKLEGFGFLPINSFTMAISTFVSQNFGAGKTERMKEGARFGVRTSVLLSELIGVLFFLFAPQLISIFKTEPEVTQFGVLWARTTSLFYCLLALSHCMAAVFRGAGKTFVPMFVMLGIWCVLRVIYITVIMHFTNDIQNIFWAYPLTWSISSVIYLTIYFKGDWARIPAAAEPPEAG